MDALQSAENSEMPRKATKSIELTEEQRTALFGDQPCDPGKTYSITLKAGDMLDGGMQSFEVSESEQEIVGEDSEASDESMGTLPPPPEEPESDEEEIGALGYDRSKVMKKRPAAPLNLRDLEFD